MLIIKFADVNKLKAIGSLLLMSMLIFSTLGFSVSRHYCQGVLVGESFYNLGNASCNSDKEDGCEDVCSYNFTCCGQQQLNIAGIEVLRSFHDSEEVKLPAQTPLAASAIHVAPLHHAALNPCSKIPPPAPPLSCREILVEVQRFII